MDYRRIAGTLIRINVSLERGDLCVAENLNDQFPFPWHGIGMTGLE